MALTIVDKPVEANKKRLLFVMLGSPYVDESITTMFRLMNSALAGGHQVIVWCCGGTTRLTCEELGDEKPRNFANFGMQEALPIYPTTSASAVLLVRIRNGLPGMSVGIVLRNTAQPDM